MNMPPYFPRKQASSLWLHYLPLMVALLLLQGCGAMSTMAGWVGLGGPPKADLRDLRLVSDIGANRNSATRVDIVLVFEQSAIGSLPKTAPEWFAQKQALLDGMPTALQVVALELPPAHVLDPVPLPDRTGKALAVRAYADMQSSHGQHVLDLTFTKAAELRLRANDYRFTVLN